MKIASVLDGADGWFDVDFASEAAEYPDQVFAHSCGLIAPDRMGILRDVFQMRHCSRRGKDIDGSGGAGGGRRPRPIDSQSACENKTEPECGSRDMNEERTLTHGKRQVRRKNQELGRRMEAKGRKNLPSRSAGLDREKMQRLGVAPPRDYSVAGNIELSVFAEEQDRLNALPARGNWRQAIVAERQAHVLHSITRHVCVWLIAIAEVILGPTGEGLF